MRVKHRKAVRTIHVLEPPNVRPERKPGLLHFFYFLSLFDIPAKMLSSMLLIIIAQTKQRKATSLIQ